LSYRIHRWVNTTHAAWTGYAREYEEQDVFDNADKSCEAASGVGCNLSAEAARSEGPTEGSYDAYTFSTADRSAASVWNPGQSEPA
jgi:hypothetical protein